MKFRVNPKTLAWLDQGNFNPDSLMNELQAHRAAVFLKGGGDCGW